MGGRTSLGALPNTRCSLSPDNSERSRSTSPGSERVAQGPRLWAGFLPLDGGQAGRRMSSHLWRNARGLRGCSFPLCCYPGSALQEMLCFRHQQQPASYTGFFVFYFPFGEFAGCQGWLKGRTSPLSLSWGVQQQNGGTSTSSPPAATQFAEPSLQLQVPRSGLCLEGPRGELTSP